MRKIRLYGNYKNEKLLLQPSPFAPLPRTNLIKLMYFLVSPVQTSYVYSMHALLVITCIYKKCIYMCIHYNIRFGVKVWTLYVYMETTTWNFHLIARTYMESGTSMLLFISNHQQSHKNNTEKQRALKLTQSTLGGILLSLH